MLKRLFQTLTCLLLIIACSETQEDYKLELPEISEEEDVVEHIGFTASYNHDTLMPNWVAYELTDEELTGTYRGKETFKWDMSLNGVQPNREDYKNDEDWNRGHMAPKADMRWSTEAYEDSFYLSNICPQNQKFNAGSWEATERMARRIANEYGRVYIVCGPIVGENKFGTLSDKKIVIPDKFFKAFLIETESFMTSIAFVMDNIPEKQDLKKSSMSVNELEKIIGLNLFCNLPANEQESIEENVFYKFWGI